MIEFNETRSRFAGRLGRVAAILLIVFAAGCAPYRVAVKPVSVPVSAGDETGRNKFMAIRVALVRKNARLKIFSTQSVGLYKFPEKKLVSRLSARGPHLFRGESRGLQVDGRELPPGPFRLIPEADGVIALNGVRYRGQIELDWNAGEKKIQVVNYLPMEDYLKGVLPNEALPAWPLETLKAQAVAARTFAFYSLGNRVSGQPFDLDDSVNSQVYRGLDSESPATNQAVDATRGVVCVFDGRFISAFYHANCGGHTADVKTVWGGTQPYLEGVTCGFCDQGPHASWEAVISRQEIGKVLSRFCPGGSLLELAEAGRDESGRVSALRLTGTGGDGFCKATQFRMSLGPDRIRSTRFYLEPGGNNFQFRGRGWGHGVGLCQEGALGMAKAGFSYLDILRHYYPGVELRKLRYEE